DYIHVVDLASAHVKAIDYMQSEKSKEKYQVFNVGTGNGSSVLEVIQSFERTSGEKLNYKIAPRREGDIAMIYADAKYTMETINWSAKYNLDDMTGSAWAWEKKLRGL
ncbi:MAG TPA: UDP-glucose 4-epimerase GalE, partial [Saprospirales bacterium]|nr:UDP-glucose 4-epimerase GalE [Saprospirales bacterium]